MDRLSLIGDDFFDASPDHTASSLSTVMKRPMPAGRRWFRHGRHRACWWFLLTKGAHESRRTWLIMIRSFPGENHMRYLQRALVCLTLIALACPPSTDAQNVTTGTLSGLVKDAQGGILPGAVVTAVHVPTGTSYEAVSQSDGRFSILNVR